MGSSEADDRMMEMAFKSGQIVAKLGVALVTGGRGGIMEAASKGCAEAGGLVLAVTPGTDMNEANPFVHYVIPTGLGWARNVITAISGDIIVIIGGASGTLSEAAFAWMYNRPIVALSESGGWAKELAGKPMDHRRVGEVIVDCRSIEELEPILRKLLADPKIRERQSVSVASLG